LGVVVAGIIALWMTRRTLPGPVTEGALAPLGWRRSPTSTIAVAALTGVALSLVYLFVLVPISPPPEEQQWGPLATAAQSGGWPRFLWAVLALVLAPPIEEFVLRGVLLSGLSNRLGIPAAALIVSLLFVIVHVTETLAYWPAWVAVGLMACAAVFFRIRSESLLPAIGAHAGYNLALVVAVYLGFA
jgi:membrane protease YdiL (CAAX protease family)